MNFERYLGVPYRDMGRSLAGCDCWGLLWLFYRDELGVDLPDYGEGYGSAIFRRRIGPLIERETAREWTRIDAAAARAGDAVLMRSGRYPAHCGVTDGRGFVLHVEAEGDWSKMEQLNSFAIAQRLLGFYRHA